MGEILKIVFVIIGTLKGAGFASGQEIKVFFFSKGLAGLLGIVLSACLIGYIIYKAFLIIKKSKVSTYKEFLGEIATKSTDTMLGMKVVKKTGKRKIKLENILNIIVNVFILTTFFVMIAGFGAYFEQELHINSLVGSIILAVATFCVLTKDVQGMVKLNTIIVPVLILFIFGTGIMNVWDNYNKIDLSLMSNQSAYNINWVVNAILYASYNGVLLIPAIITLKNYIISKKQIGWIAIFVAILTIILSLIIVTFIATLSLSEINNVEMPAVYVMSKMGSIFALFYGFVILASIFTTSVSLGVSFLKNVVGENKKLYVTVAILICVVSVLVSRVGFSNLVERLYPLLGFLGLIQVIMMIRKKYSK